MFLLVYSFFSPPHNAEWGQRSQPEPRECVQRGDEAKNKQVLEKKRTGSLLRRKKELCPVAGTQTGWFGWGMVSQKHLREADSVTIATRRPDRQHVLSVLWLMPAARLALAMARHMHAHMHTCTHALTNTAWQSNEPNLYILCTDKWTRIAQTRQDPYGALYKGMTNTNDNILLLLLFCKLFFPSKSSPLSTVIKNFRLV